MKYVLAFDKSDKDYESVYKKVEELSPIDELIDTNYKSVRLFVSYINKNELIEEFKKVFIEGDNAHLISISPDSNDLNLDVDIIIESRQPDETKTLRKIQYVITYDIPEKNKNGGELVRKKLVNDYHAIKLSESVYQFDSNLNCLEIDSSFDTILLGGGKMCLMRGDSANGMAEIFYYRF